MKVQNQFVSAAVLLSAAVEQGQVHGAPQQERGPPGDVDVRRHHRHRGSAPDGRHAALVEVVERFGILVLAEHPVDRLADVLSGLQRHGTELWEDLVGLRVGDRGHVAHHEDLRTTLQVQHRPHGHPSVLQIVAERGCQGARGQTCGPHGRRGLDDLTGAQHDRVLSGPPPPLSPRRTVTPFFSSASLV